MEQQIIEEYVQLNDVCIKFLKNYESVLTSLGCFEGEHHIVIDKNVTSVIHPSRKIPLSIHPLLKETLETLEEEEIIAKVE